MGGWVVFMEISSLCLRLINTNSRLFYVCRIFRSPHSRTVKVPIKIVWVVHLLLIIGNLKSNLKYVRAM